MNRTTFVTVASVGGVLIAGAAVIGANFGILNAADASTPLGDLSSAAEPTTTTSSTTSTTPETAALAVYQVEDAGTVEVIETPAGLSFGSVEPAAGWVWVPESEGETLTGVFSNGTVSIQFHAVQTDGVVHAEIVAIGSDGTAGPGSPIASNPRAPAATAPVAPTTAPESAPTSPTTAPGSYDDDDEQYEDDDHDDDDHDDEHDDHDDEHDDDDDDADHDDEHEGRDDDD